MWHWLTQLFNHGSKHVHHVTKHAHHATKHITPTLGQMASAASVVSGVNAGLTLYERLKMKSESATNNEPGTVEDDKMLFNDFLLHIEQLEKTIQTCSIEIQTMKDKSTSLTNDIQSLKNTTTNFDTLTKGHTEELSRHKDLFNKANKEIEILTADNIKTNFILQQARKSIKSLTIFSISITLIVIIVSVFFYYKYSQQ